MALNSTQIIILCLATIFGLFLLAAILFAIYASRRAHNETREAGVAVLGRWKENRGMEVPPVPKVPGRAKGSGSGSDRASDAEKGQAGGVKDEKAQMSVGRRLSGLAGIGARGLGVGRGSYEPVPPPPAAGRDTGYSKSAQGPKPPSKDRVPAASKTRTPRSPARSAVSAGSSTSSGKAVVGEHRSALTRENLAKVSGGKERVRRSKSRRGPPAKSPEERRGEGRERDRERERGRERRFQRERVER